MKLLMCTLLLLCWLLLLRSRHMSACRQLPVTHQRVRDLMRQRHHLAVLIKLKEPAGGGGQRGEGVRQGHARRLRWLLVGLGLVTGLWPRRVL
jgi:hypothetical protein